MTRDLECRVAAWEAEYARLRAEGARLRDALDGRGGRTYPPCQY